MPTAALKRVLIVEDETAIAKVLQLKISKAGYEAVIASNGNVALAELKKGAFDLILLDILMPELDGWEVLKQLKSTNANVVITSNLSQQEDIQKAKDLGAKDFLVKSNTSLSEIADKVKVYLGEG